MTLPNLETTDSSLITSSLAHANVVINYLGRNDDMKSKLWRTALVLTSLPALSVIAIGFDSFKRSCPCSIWCANET